MTHTKTTNKKSRLGLKIFAVVLTVILLTALFFVVRAQVHGKSPAEGYGKDFDKATSQFKLEDFPSLVVDANKESIKIMQIADPQMKFGSFTSDTRTMELIGRALDVENPDICVVTGDLTLSVFTYDAYKYFADFMEQRKQYWTLTYGNHDAEFDCSKYTLSKLLAKYKYCLFDAGPRNIHGESNFLVNVFRGSVSNANLCYSLVLLDSGMYPQDHTTLGDWVYDWIRQDQMDWYVWAIDGLKQCNPSVQSSMFFHIPVKQFATMYYLNEQKLGKQIPQEVKDSLTNVQISQVTGVVREGDKSPTEIVYGDDGYSVGIYYQGNTQGADDHPDVFEYIKQSNCTKAVFCGHDHVNTLKGYYDGIYLAYGRSCGYHTYPFFEKPNFITKLFGLDETILFNGEFWRDDDGNILSKGFTIIDVDVNGANYGALSVVDKDANAYFNAK